MGSTSQQTRCLIQGVVWVLAILKECAVILLLMPNWCLVCLRSIRSCLPSTILFETDITVIKNVLHVIKYIIIYYYYYCYYYYYLLQTGILTQILICSYEGCESQIVSYPQLHTVHICWMETLLPCLHSSSTWHCLKQIGHLENSSHNQPLNTMYFSSWSRSKAPLDKTINLKFSLIWAGYFFPPFLLAYYYIPI